MVWKISSLYTSKRTKLSLTIKTDDVTSSRKDVDLHGWLRAGQGRMGQISQIVATCNGYWFNETHLSYSLPILNSWKSLENNLPINFQDLEKVWKTEIKSWKNGKKSWGFFESCNKCITGEIFLCWSNLTQSRLYICSASWKKLCSCGFFLKVWLSMDHLFDNFESWKRNYCFIWKTSGKCGSKNPDEPCSQLEGWGICSLLTKYDVIGVGHLSKEMLAVQIPGFRTSRFYFFFVLLIF